jgi:hypothetical protein
VGKENCRSLRSGRDNKVEGGDLYYELSDRMDRRKQQVPPLRFAPLGMTKERTALTLAAVTGDGESCRVSLGFAPNDKKRRNECSGIPLKPKSGLNGAPIWSISQQLWWASPGFPVEFGGVGASHAAFLTESRTRGRVRCSVQEIRVDRLFRPRYALANLGTLPVPIGSA